MTPVQVVGIGLDGAVGLSDAVRQIVEQATLLVGSDRHLSYFPNHLAQRLVLGDLHHAIQTVQQHLSAEELHSSAVAPLIIVLVSGDPLFFGLGRLLLAELSPDQLTFHPHISSVQLAFSRVKVPWQDAQILSAHGRSLEEVTQAVQQGIEKIAVLTDGVNTPAAIARLLLALDLPVSYRCWVCENLGGKNERVQSFSAPELINQRFDLLNVVVLLRSIEAVTPLDLQNLPALGLPDQRFLSFSDRPGLMTKREVRLLVLGELALQPQQIIWDIGAGTGSVAIEVARLFPTSQVYAIEKTAVGTTLIQQNSQRFQVSNVISLHGTAPAALPSLPAPNRIFIGGSGGNLTEILNACAAQLSSKGVIVIALATVEHLNVIFTWLGKQAIQEQWQHRLLHIQLSRSVPIGLLTRFAPLNPVTLVTLTKGQGLQTQ